MRIRKSDLIAYALLTAAGAGAVLLPSDLGIETATAAGAPIDVPMELALLVDTSSSVNPGEYELQKRGYYEAFSAPEFGQLIERLGGIAVIYIEWARQGRETVQIPWTHLETADDCLAFANAVNQLDRAPTDDTTHLATALVFAHDQMESNNFQGLRQVIDVSGDGRCKIWTGETSQYHGPGWDAELAKIPGNVTINGISIGDSDVMNFYADVVVRGADSFAMHVSKFSDFRDAINAKLRREIGDTPRLGYYD
jgi:hypothetical protein